MKRWIQFLLLLLAASAFGYAPEPRLSGPLCLNEQYNYTYDKAGNLWLRTNGSSAQTFNCDALNQLTNITRNNSVMTVSGATPAPAASVTVNGQPAQTYGDFTFARTNVSLSDGNNTFSFAAQSLTGSNTASSLTVSLPQSVTLRWDSNGNLTNDGTRSFGYSPENLLTNITVAAQWKVDLVHDGLGRCRIERDYAWQGGQWTKTNEFHVIYDGYLPVQVRDSNNNVLWTLTRGLDLSGTLAGAGGIGGVLARSDGNGSAFYHADGAGNITGLMDGQQNMAARYMYSAFGVLGGKWGPMADVNRIMFSSKEHLPNADDIYHFGSRDWFTRLHRWGSRDALGEQGDINLYRGMGNDPLGYIDPYGLAFHLTGASGSQTPGPLGYLSGDTALEQVSAAGYNLIPAAGNLIANALSGLGQLFGGAVDLSKELAREMGGSPSDQELVGAGVALGSVVIAGPEARLGKLPCAAEGGIPNFIYRTGSQTENALTDAAGVSFRDSISSSANRAQVFDPGAKIWAVDTSTLPSGSVVLDGNPAGHVSVFATPSEIRAAIVPQSPANPLGDFGLKLLEDGTSYRIPKK